MDRFHQDWIRVPMMVLALLGSSLNLMILMQIRNLRNRLASRLTPKTTESDQNPYGPIADGFVARYPGLVGIEEYLHVRWCGHL